MQVELVPGAAILLVLVLLTVLAFRFHQARCQLPPGPRPWLFLGNLLRKDALPLYKTYRKLTKKYGPVFTIWLGPKPMVVVCGYEAVKDALVTHSEEFGGRPSIPIINQLTKGYGLISEDVKWRTLRRFMLSTLRNFGMGKKSMAERISEEALCLVEKMAASEGQPFDFIPATTAAASNVMCSVVFGNRFSYEDKNFMELLETLKAFLNFFVSVPGVVFSALPNIMKFLPGPHNKVFCDCNKIFNFIRNKVDSHKKNLDPQNPGDFIDCFLLKLEK
ncbi:cytochrome P450 2C55-like, partial [Python bivittatus]|uniref:Cytochrome P450 2C55-like n=1 Tax=Python bivittatus TaxID=176946 RepID=A0A9F2RFG3_PYTBI